VHSLLLVMCKMILNSSLFRVFLGCLFLWWLLYCYIKDLFSKLILMHEEDLKEILSKLIYKL